MWRQIVLAMVRPKMARRNSRICHLVVAGGVESDGIRLRLLPRYLSQCSGDGRAVRSPAQETADLVISGLGRNGISKQLPELGLQLSNRGFSILFESWRPVSRYIAGPVVVPKRGSGRKSPYPFEYGSWR